MFLAWYVWGSKKKDLKSIQSNVGLSYALYDEGAWQNKLGHGNMGSAPEALNLVNQQIRGYEPIEKILIGNYYGQLKNRTMTIVYNEKVLHPFQPYSTEAISNQIEFF